ncbi:hypothetical protein L6E12_18115 [Actinokineospora sp. PR83]|uniref:DddA-like double-stranded DNA deaminase toxin n=1 Tax=Actinokineospora sp. PR83 TaxID=2884908 RepID=UPI0027E03348|nr:DddA-like double-stranded DNA deaminase toxin [Actinokineospora sp. PR83]MCG8917701.1 hypothetical protein [Actinokineospora sp. PR83]
MRELAAALHAVLTTLTTAREYLVVAAAVIEKAASILGYMPPSYAAVLEELRAAWRSIIETEQLVDAHLATLQGPGHGAPSSGAPQAPAQVQPRSIPAKSHPAPSSAPPVPGVENKHGDRYPTEAVPYCDDLPPRVRRGTRNVPIVGYVQVDGRDVGTITAYKNDGWAEDSARRLIALRMGQARLLANHVEMKVVVMMLQNRAREGRVIINHAPCGYEVSRTGCHDYLPYFLPEGHALTVLGTDSEGNAFKNIYHGRAAL